MSNQIAPFTYEIFTTADGSPTMSFPGGEKMHSLHGALTESAYIYLPAIERGFSRQGEPHILSMGLGLGYNEWLAVAALLRRQRETRTASPTIFDSTGFGLHSFELVDPLRIAFMAWLQGHPDSPVTSTFAEVVQRVADLMEVRKETLFELGQELFRVGAWQIHGPLPLWNPSAQKFHVLLYDAFSGQSDGHLWEEDFLVGFLKEFAAESCELTTYAATGNLNRALKREGFQVEKIKGFAVKRQSTRAIRGDLHSKVSM